MSQRKILVPIDFSDSTDNVVSTSAALAEDLNAQLWFVHVDEMHASSSALGEDHFVYIPRGCQMEEAERPTWFDELCHATAGVHCECRELAGNPVDEIVAFARRERFDMIVMGSHGRTGLSRLLMGSVAEGVSRSAPCPVLIVRSAPNAVQ